LSDAKLDRNFIDNAAWKERSSVLAMPGANNC